MFKNFDLKLYKKTLKNGLEIYIVPKSNVNDIYATYTTKYGSNDIEFSIDGKMKKYPLGIAHFLEHKLFEQIDGVDPFTFYSERGANANANTNYFKTTYLFEGTTYFEENLKYLLNYVESPYFTDENVLKEKGIIEQEIKMYQDYPMTVLYEGILKNAFVKHPIRDPIIGDLENINKITKKDLYECYNTFYSPNNMILVITGNVEPKKTFELIEEFEQNHQEQIEIKRKNYIEPDKVNKKLEKKKMNISTSIAGIGYKLIIKKGLDLYKLLWYLFILFDIKFGGTSKFTLKLKEDKLINDDLNYDFIDITSHVLCFVGGESNNYEELIKRINNELKDTKIDETDFNRKKKAMISSLIFMTDNIVEINNRIVNEVVKYGKVVENNLDLLKSLNILEFEKVISNLSFENNTIYIVEPFDLH